MSEFFENDHFNRIEDAELIERFLTKRVQEKKFGNTVGTYVLNLDSAWGTGKTYFLDGFAEYLQSPQGGNHLAIKINAWKDDYSSDPLPYITASITQGIRRILKNNDSKTKPIAKNLGKIALAGGKGIAKQLLAKHVGDDAMRDVTAAMSDAAIDQAGSAILNLVDRQKNAIEDFEKALIEAAQEVEKAGKVAPIFVLVDELDRCRPDYAIKFLERIKHFFAVKGFVFIIATDTKQLTSSIRGAYGAEFDGEKYLQRFFDRTYRFAIPSMTDFVASGFDAAGLKDSDFDSFDEYPPQKFIAHVLECGDVKLREAQQILDILESCATIWNYEIPINIVYLLPKILAYYYRLPMDLKPVDGENPNYFLKVKFNTRSISPPGVHRPSEHTIVTLESIIRQFGHLDRWSYFKSKSNFGNYIENWIAQSKNSELSKRHNNITGTDALVTALSTYDELIRSVGRIEKQKDAD